MTSLAPGRLQVETAALPENYRESDGTVSVELVAQSPGRTAVLNTTSSPSGLLSVPTVGGALQFSDLDLALADLRRCITKKTSDHKKALETYVQANGDNRAKVSVIQKVSAVHRVGVAISVKGGPYGASGTASSAWSGGDYSAPDAHGDSRQWKNRVNYYRYRTTCVGGYYSDSWRPTTIAAMNVENQFVSHPYYEHCEAQYAGKFGKSKGRTDTFGAGVDLDVVKVSAEAQWGSDVTLEWKADRRVQYCGNHQDGPAQSAKVEVHD